MSCMGFRCAAAWPCRIAARLCAHIRKAGRCPLSEAPDAVLLLLRGALLLVLDEGAVLVGGQFAVAVGISGAEHATQRGMGLGLGTADAAVAVGIKVRPALALAAGAGLLALLLGGASRGLALGLGLLRLRHLLLGGRGALRERERRGGNHAQEQQAGRGAGVVLVHWGYSVGWKDVSACRRSRPAPCTAADEPDLRPDRTENGLLPTAAGARCSRSLGACGCAV